ncbi:pyridoxamine 5'-phosphate oxidase-domain-containing protein [Cantharellus anzutake]|uniref:pyridoxamine 5'-phosphate oxidase-domain-containing protein n=1 Tax=Cantharellus anzutake TaxID=1750568 RepID=UPI001906CDB0|nr:pyridoxamine 5'-phosphate oxidase-domain-containing protein [Cantharellus anzutake]KAF8316478.1 pyridoxamine 5'-phosphate oxidase-domain-containing protein [Cantharellus anzutake]
MEYYAPCYPNGSLALILVNISQSATNIWASPTHAATFTIRAPLSLSPVSKPRVALIGSVSAVGPDNDLDSLEECYVDRHPDATSWIPGKSPFQDVQWARFDPSIIYYVGGFGGVHYIGWIPLDLYQRSGNEAFTPQRENGDSYPYLLLEQ